MGARGALTFVLKIRKNAHPPKKLRIKLLLITIRPELCKTLNAIFSCSMMISIFVDLTTDTFYQAAPPIWIVFLFYFFGIRPFFFFGKCWRVTV